MQNTAAQFLQGSRKFDRVTPILAEIHWLPISFPTQFKVLVSIIKALNGVGPGCLQDCLHVYQPSRSGGEALGTVRETRLGGTRSSAAAPCLLGSSLPLEACLVPSLLAFRRQIKAEL